jgi:murein DD-endopeptidase MepM/ murein hydrolase activator NlpD
MRSPAARILLVSIILVCVGLLWAFLVVPDSHRMVLPIAGLTAKDLYDTFPQQRDGKRHEAIDIMAPRGTPVRAVVNGVIQKLFLSKPGGNTIYLFDDAQPYSYYYAHLDRYSPGLREGMHVSRGEVIGYVGSSGNANPAAPHLHFMIYLLGPEKRWWQGTPINPYPVLMQVVQR